MKKTRNVFTVMLALMLAAVMLVSLTACVGNTDPSDSKGGEASVGGSVGGDNPSGTDGEKPDPSNPSQSGSVPTDPSTGKPIDLKITVTPAELEIYAGEEIDLLFGVKASDPAAKLIIQDDDDFDVDTPGVYTITYKATKGSASVTATRKITVLQARSALGLDVRTNYLGEQKWTGNTIRFAYALYVELSSDTSLKAQSGVFHNTANREITLSVEGAYGCSAVIDSNGVVREGRDGANSRLVNAANPQRASSSATTLVVDGETVTVSSAFAKNLKIPAGGYAIVVQPNYVGTTADTDGRSFMNYNVIYAVGNVIRLYWVDNAQNLTPYVNQAPVVSGNNKILAQWGDANFDLDTMVLAGIVAKDDNGTFATADDATLTDIRIVDRGGFDINKPGTYTIRLSVSDGSLTTSFTREVEVKTSGIGVIAVGDAKHNVATEKVAINQALSGIGGYAYIIYTPAYNGSIGYANGYGEAFVVDKYGKLVRIYDGANGKYYDASNPSGIQDASKCTPTGYLNEAFASLGAGETLIVAPNSTANNAEGGSRWFLNRNKVIGAQMLVMDLQFETGTTVPDPDPDPKPDTDPDPTPDPDPEQKDGITIGENFREVAADRISVNTTTATAADKDFYIFTTDFTGTLGFKNGYGVAMVIKDGKIVRIYDGANGKYRDAENPAGITDASKCTAADYLNQALSSLEGGEWLLVATNNGGANEARKFLLDNRTIGAEVKLNGVTVTPANKAMQTLRVKDSLYFGAVIAMNADVTDASKFDLAVYSYGWSGVVVKNGWAEVFVIDAEGKIVKIYDCFNGKYYDEANPAGIARTDELYTVAGVVHEAFEALEPGQTLVIGLNGGANGSAARKFLAGNRAFGEKLSLSGVELPAASTEKVQYMAITVNGKTYFQDAAKIALNAPYEGAPAFAIYDYGYADARYTGGYGVALIIDKATGKTVKVYDGASGKYWDAENAGVGGICTAAGYAKEAFEALQPGQYVLIAPNGGSAGNVARGFLYGNRNVGLDASYVLLGAQDPDPDPDPDPTPDPEPEQKDGITIGENFREVAADRISVNTTTATAADKDFYIFTTDFTGTLGFKNGYGVAMVIKDGKIVRIYDGANGKYRDAENPAGITDATKCTSAEYLPQALSSLQGGEWLLVATNNGGANEARKFLLDNRTIGAEVKLNGITVTPGAKSMQSVKVKDNTFFSNAIAVNAEVTDASKYDFVVYTYGWSGVVIKNGWCEIFVLDAEGKIVRIYDGVNGKYYDAENPAGIPRTDAHYALATESHDAFKALQPGQTMVIGLNGGLESNRARKFLLDNRSFGQQVSLTGVQLPEASAEEVQYMAITVNGKTYFQDVSKVAINAPYTGSGAPAFAIYDYGYTGARYTGGYGVALVVDKTTGKTVKVYDGASGKYWDAENAGVGGICTAAGYAQEAFEALQPGQYVLIAPNGGSAGNAARGFLYGNRNVNLPVSYEEP